MITPVLDKVVVKPEAKKDTSAGGIYVPEALDDDKPGNGTVLAVGPGKVNEKTGELDPLQVQVGDTVVFGRKSGVSVDTDEGQVLIMHEAEILAVLR